MEINICTVSTGCLGLIEKLLPYLEQMELIWTDVTVNTCPHVVRHI